MQLGIFDPPREVELALVHVAEDHSEGVGYARSGVSLVDGYLEVMARAFRVLEGPKAATERIVAGSGADRAEPGHFLLDPPHLFTDDLPFGCPVVQGHHCRHPGHAFDLLGLFGQVLRDDGLAPSTEVRAQAPQTERSEGEDDGDRRGDQPRVLANLLTQLVEQTGSPGLDGFVVEESAKVFGGLAGGGVAAVLLLLEALENDGLEVHRDRTIDAMRWDRVPLGDAGHDFGIPTGIGALPGQEPVQRRAQPVDVSPPVKLGGFAPHLLRCAECRCAEDHPGYRELVGCIHLASNSEIDHVGVPASVGVAFDEDVGGLDVAVDETGLVGGVQRVGHIDHDRRLLTHIREIGDLLDRTTGDVLHGDVGVPLDLADLVHRTQILVVHLCLNLGLAGKTSDLLGVVPTQKLERHVAAEARVAGFEHVAHPAAPNELHELVAIPIGDREDLEWVVGDGGLVLASACGRGAGQPIFVVEAELAREFGEGVVLEQMVGQHDVYRRIVEVVQPGGLEPRTNLGDGRLGLRFGKEATLRRQVQDLLGVGRPIFRVTRGVFGCHRFRLG